MRIKKLKCVNRVSDSCTVGEFIGISMFLCAVHLHVCCSLELVLIEWLIRGLWYGHYTSNTFFICFYYFLLAREINMYYETVKFELTYQVLI